MAGAGSRLSSQASRSQAPTNGWPRQAQAGSKQAQAGSNAKASHAGLARQKPIWGDSSAGHRRTDPADECVGQLGGGGQNDVHAPQPAGAGAEDNKHVVEPGGKGRKAKKEMKGKIF